MRACALACLVVAGCSRIPRDEELPGRLSGVRRPPPAPALDRAWQDGTTRTLPVSSGAWCSDYRRYVTVSEDDYQIELHDLDGAVRRVGRLDGYPEHIAWSADCTAVAMVSGLERVHAWDLDQRRKLPVMRGDGYDHEEGRDVYGIELTSHAELVLAPRPHRRGRPLPELHNAAGEVVGGHEVALSDDERWLVGPDQVWDARTLAPHCRMPPELFVQPPSPIVVPSPALRLVDFATCSVVFEFPEVPEWASATPSPDRKRIVFTGEQLQLVDTASKRVLLEVEPPAGERYREAAFSTDGALLALTLSDRTVELRDAHSGALLAAKQHTVDAYADPVISPDGRRVVLLDYYRDTWLWER